MKVLVKVRVVSLISHYEMLEVVEVKETWY